MAGAEPEVVLSVRGKRHEGWEQVTVRASMEELAHSFSVQYTPRAFYGGAAVEIEPGDPVEIRVGTTLVLTGYVDDSVEEYDASSHSVSVIGRSKTGDLVDCAAIYEGGSITGKNLYEVAKLLCAPFGIGVVIDAVLSDLFVGTGSEPTVQIQDGESVFETLSALARKESVLMLSNPAGNLVLCRAATIALASAQLASGNIKRGSLRSSVRERYSSYLIKGQSPTNDALSQLSTSALKFELADDEVKRYRPFVAIDHQSTVADLEQRATWERNTRAGRSAGLTYDVQGWKHAQGLWQPNQLLRVIDTRLQIDSPMLVVSVELQRDVQGGRVARLELMPRETFDVLKPPKPLKKKRDKLAGLL